MLADEWIEERMRLEGSGYVATLETWVGSGSEAIIKQADGRAVVEDMMRIREASSGILYGKISAAHMFWRTLLYQQKNPYAPQEAERTLYVVETTTTMESYPATFEYNFCVPLHELHFETQTNERNGPWSYWFTVARQALEMHRGAHRVRIVKPLGHYKPAAGEVLLSRRKKRDKFFVHEVCGVKTCRHNDPLLTYALGEQV